MCGGVVHCMSLKVHKVISEFVLQADSTVVLDLLLPPVGMDEALCKHITEISNLLAYLSPVINRFQKVSYICRDSYFTLHDN